MSKENREKLGKTLKPHWVGAIAFGSAIGWGSFVLPTDWLAIAGPLGVLIGFAIGAAMMIIIAVNYGFLIELYPVAGGEFSYTYAGFGRTHAIICGWFLALGYISIVALNASALALLGKFVFPSLTELGLLYSIAGWDVHLGEVVIASLALVLFALLNIRGSSFSGRSQFIFCVILVAGAVLVSIGMVISPETSFGNLRPFFNPDVPTFAAIAAIVAIAPWAYVGFDNIPQAAEEFAFPPAKAFLLIVLALIFAFVHYAMLVVATALAVPWTELISQKELWGTASAIQGVLGSTGLLLLAISLCMGIFTGLNGFYLSSSRLLFAMGRAKILPTTFSQLHPVYNTPTVGIVFTCAVCLVAPWFGREVLLWIVDMAAVGVTVAYFYTCAVAYKCFRWSHTKDDRENPEERSVAPIRKSLALIGALTGISFFGLLLIPGSPGFLSKPSWYALAIWSALGAAFYAVRHRQYRQVPKAVLDHMILELSEDKTDDPVET